MQVFSDAFKTIFDIISAGQTDLWHIVLTSLKVSLIATIVASLPGIASGFIMAVTSFKGRRLLISLFNTSLAIPTVVVGLFLYGFLSRRGILGEWGLLYTSTAMVIGQAVLIFPIVVTFVHSAVKSVDPRIKKTAQALGAGTFHTTIAIAREAKFGLILAIIAAFGRAISEVGVSMMLGGNISGFTRNMTTTIALEHNKGNFALALAIGVILLTVTFSINISIHYIQRFTSR
ncbi:MAG: ABC transporter permease subunit [bacterium]|nr:ABC transporter permease subunit [bacterium]